MNGCVSLFSVFFYFKSNINFIKCIFNCFFCIVILIKRKYLLDEPRIYNLDEAYGAYYENSKIDQYLNNRFLKTLGEDVQTKIVTSHLEITA